jgi:ferredoxin
MCKAIPACPNGAISYVEDEEEPLGGRIVFDQSKCKGCGKCAEECCGKAIEMKEA